VLLEDREEARRALQLVERLPARERVVLWMALVDERSQREIAGALGLSEGYVSKLLDRAKARVRREGWEVEDGRA
jgi:RNA polymerase sigma-70 factor (ECF subfamily)